MDWLSFILSILTLIAGGGWFVCYQTKKKMAKVDLAEKEVALTEKEVDLTDKLVRNYQEVMLSVMDGHTNKVSEEVAHAVKEACNGLNCKMDTISDRLSAISDSTAHINMFLSQNFSNYKPVYRDEFGRFTKIKEQTE